MKKIVLISVLLACISAVVCSLILVKPSILFRNEGSIKVKGSTSQTVNADVASWNAYVYASDVNAAEAYKKVQTAKDIVFEFIKAAGVDEKEIKTSLNFMQIFKRNSNGYETGEVLAYKYTLSISYGSNNILSVEKLSKDAVSLVEKGISIDSNPPQYFYSKLESLKLDLMAKASENAKERAKVLVSGSGAKLGKVISASQGVFQITRPLSTETSDYGMYDTSSPTKQVNCVVTMEFAVE